MQINQILDNLFEAAEKMPQQLYFNLNFEDMREHKYFATKYSVYWVNDENELYSSEIYSREKVDDVQFFMVYSSFGSDKYLVAFKSENEITEQQAIDLDWDI